MQKSLEVKAQEMKIKTKFIRIFSGVCCEFRNLRINHGLIIFVCIWNRIFMGTCLNITQLLKQKNSFFNSIDQLWITLMSYVTRSQLQIFNLIFLLLFLLISIITFIWILFANRSKREPIIITILITQLNYLLLRYFLSILFAISHFQLQSCLLFLTITSIFFLFMFQLLFLVISASSKNVNQNLLTYHKKKFIPIKQIMVFILVILAETSLSIENQLMGLLINCDHLALSLISLYSLCSQFLYQSKFTETVYESAICFETTISFCVFIAILTEDPLFIENMAFLVFSIMLFMCIAGHQYIAHRNIQIIFSQDSSQLNTKNYLQLLTYFLTDCSDRGQNQFFANLLKNQHQQKCNNPTCVCQLTISSYEEKNALLKILVLNKLNSIIQNENSFQVVLQSCYLKLNFFQSYTDLLSTLCAKKTVNLSILNKLQQECMKKQIEKYLEKRKSQDNPVNTQLIQRQDVIIVDFFNSIVSQSFNKELFWFKLHRNNILSTSLEESLSQSLHSSLKCDSIIQQIFRLFSFSKLLLDFIVFYESSVELKSDLTKQLKQCLRNCRKIVTEKAKLLKQNQFKLDLLLFQKYTVCFESKIQESNMGIIYNVSKNIQQTFGYQRDLIIGQNINVIMPKSMQKQHDFILESWREKCSWSNFHKIRHIFAMTNERTCFQTTIYLRIIQREQSINIIATFVKANENDYMLVNENGVIDGIGYNLKHLLGEDVVKLPFSFICERASSIMDECRTKKIKKTSKLHLYHVKGLEQILDSYQQSRYKIVQNSENIEVSQKIFRVKDRLLKLYFSYESYWMGRKFFVIFKLLQKSDEVKKRRTYKLAANNTNNLEEMQSQTEKQIIGEGSSDIVTLNEPNSNIDSSNCEASVSNELIFLDLHQRYKNMSFKIQSKKLCCNLFINLTIFFIYLILIVTQEWRISIQDNGMKNLLEIERFSEKMNSLNLAYSDFISIKRLDKGQQFQSYLSKAMAQLAIVQNAIDNLNYKQLSQNVNTQFVKSLSQNQIEFNEYYTKHLNIYKHLKESEGFFREQINIMIQFLEKNKINQNVQLAQDQIQVKLNSVTAECRIFLALYLLFLFVFFFFTFKIVNIQNLQSSDILSILLMVNEKNCQACNNYYKNMNRFLEKVRTELRHHENIPQKIQFSLTQSSMSRRIQNLSIDPERSIGKKSLIRVSSTKSSVGLFFASIIYLVVFLLKWNTEQSIFTEQIHEREKSISLLEESRKIILNYTQVKQIVYAETVNHYVTESLQYYLQQNQKQEKEKEGFMDIIFHILRQNERNSPFYQQSLNEIVQNFLCQVEILQNQILHKRICENNKSQEYQTLKLFTAHSLIKESITQIVSLILNSSNNDWSLYQGMLKTIDQIVALQFLLTRRLIRVFNLKIAQGNKMNRVNIYLLFSGIYFLFLILFFSYGYLLKRTNNKMNQNCGKLLIVPQIILKKTKGAMKSIQGIVNY